MSGSSPDLRLTPVSGSRTRWMRKASRSGVDGAVFGRLRTQRRGGKELVRASARYCRGKPAVDAKPMDVTSMKQGWRGDRWSNASRG
jgi:hypothetical protein